MCFSIIHHYFIICIGTNPVKQVKLNKMHQYILIKKIPGEIIVLVDLYLAFYISIKGDDFDIHC